MASSRAERVKGIVAAAEANGLADSKTSLVAFTLVNNVHILLSLFFEVFEFYWSDTVDRY